MDPRPARGPCPNGEEFALLSARRGFQALVFGALTLTASGCGLQGCAQSFFNPTGKSTGAKLTAPKSARAGDTITLDATGSEIQTGVGEPRCPKIVRFYLGPPETFSNKKVDPKPIAVIKPTTNRVGEGPKATARWSTARCRSRCRRRRGRASATSRSRWSSRTSPSATSRARWTASVHRRRERHDLRRHAGRDRPSRARARPTRRRWPGSSPWSTRRCRAGRSTSTPARASTATARSRATSGTSTATAPTR